MNKLFIYPQAKLIAGVDEVGRGPLVGAVVTAAVILDPSQPIEGLADSKKLSEKKRLAFYIKRSHKKRDLGALVLLNQKKSTV